MTSKFVQHIGIESIIRIVLWSYCFGVVFFPDAGIQARVQGGSPGTPPPP